MNSEREGDGVISSASLNKLFPGSCGRERRLGGKHSTEKYTTGMFAKMLVVRRAPGVGYEAAQVGASLLQRILCTTI